MQILTTPWVLNINNGAAEKYQTVSKDILKGMTALEVTFDLHGTTLLNGFDNAALIFDQGDWKVASLAKYARDGFNGVQTVSIPLSEFKAQNGVALDTTKLLTDKFHCRFWNTGVHTIEITSAVLKGSTTKLSALLFSQQAKVGEKVFIGIRAETGNEAIAGMDVYLNIGNLRLVNMFPGSIFPQVMPTTVEGSVVKVGLLTDPGTTKVVNGVVAVIECEATQAGIVPITFDFTPGSTRDSNFAQNGLDILTEVQNNQLTVTQ